MPEANLVDISGDTRIRLSLKDPLQQVDNSRLIDVHLSGPIYDIHADAILRGLDRDLDALDQLLKDLVGKATYSIWGLGDYRIEKHLLICELEGDGRGHFEVEVNLAEKEVCFKDKFVTDQTCLATFIDSLTRFCRSSSG